MRTRTTSALSIAMAIGLLTSSGPALRPARAQTARPASNPRTGTAATASRSTGSAGGIQMTKPVNARPAAGHHPIRSDLPEGATRSPARPAAEEAATGSSPRTGRLPLVDQERLAASLYEEMAQTPTTATEVFERLHRRVIDECPDTPWCESSFWRLSNLYLVGNAEPDWDQQIPLLEEFVQRFPTSPLYGEAKERLLIAARANGDHALAAKLFGELFTINPQPDDDQYAAWALGYAEALDGLGRRAEARQWCENLLQRIGTQDRLECRTARALLEAWQ